uniref:RNA helicase n=1 Tax=Caenorhabditis tropicalis TaxID=1561998 RepID=A0A1I7USR2_9PELO
MASDDEEDFKQLQISQNRKHRKAGGWQQLGLDHTIFKAIEKKGFNQPTPIQRKTIPCIMDGKDVVAMSRTGSGKTAAFVIPMLQKLKGRDTKGIRALMVSPTRELALQTFKVVKELGRFTGLRCACLVGGDVLEEQFSTIHENPDILLATPGRLLHVIVEMDLRLSHVQYVVFDEADRLFEMGFQDQLTETLKRIPESRQTILFSATLPKMLVDFAKAGLTDPMLVRLDVDEKVSEKLSMVFCMCRPDEKLFALLHLCRRMDRENKQTVVFCATMKHVEYVVGILHRAGIDCSFVYSQLDATARKQNIQKFHEKQNNILVVTDVAARGVDIPLLDTVINLHFPSKAKLFVHRVGRVARAGRSGTAISLIANDELPYLTDLFMFLGKPIRFAKDGSDYKEDETLIGRVPDSIVSLETEFFNSIHDNNEEMQDLRQKATNAMMKYTRTRQPPSAESARRVKQDIRTDSVECAPHPFLRAEGDKQSNDILNRIAQYKSRNTIFEMNKSQKSQALAVMQAKRKAHEPRISTVTEEKRKQKEERERDTVEEAMDTVEKDTVAVDEVDEGELAEIFGQMIGSTRHDEKKTQEEKKKKGGAGKTIDRQEQMKFERQKHYIPYTSSDHVAERQLALDKVDFARQAEGASVDIIMDDDRGMYQQKHGQRWDRRLKKYVGLSGNEPANKKIRTEDGTWLPASYKTGKYEEWKQKQKIGFKKNDGEEDGDGGGQEDYGRKRKWKDTPSSRGGKGGPKHSELKNKDQILKGRRKQEKLENYMEHRRQSNLKKKAMGTGASSSRGGGRGGFRRGGASSSRGGGASRGGGGKFKKR